MFYLTRMCLRKLCYSDPSAYAIIRGSDEFPEIQGTLYIYDMPEGCVVMAEAVGLPDLGRKGAVSLGKNGQTANRSMQSRKLPCQMEGSQFFGLHIHEGKRCGRTAPEAEAFSAAGGHFNPWNCPHSYHAGDLPPLLSSNGYAWLAVYTERFTSVDVLGRTVIIHDMPDDFSSQPAGNSGKRIACGGIIA